MPNKAPAKVRISPKAISTELWIAPGGGMMNPVISRPQPTKIRRMAASNCIVGLCLLRFIFSRVKLLCMWRIICNFVYSVHETKLKEP